MLKHEYLRNTTVTTKFGTVKIDNNGVFLGLNEGQEKELSQSRDTKFVVKEKKEVNVETTTTTSTTSTTSTTKKPRKPRTPRKTTTKE